MSGEKVGSTVSERGMYELKLAAMKYYNENGVTDRMEEVLNSMFFTNPEDVYGHLCNFFAAHCKTPTICGVTGKEVLDTKGNAALQTSVYGKVKNCEKLLSSTVVSSRSTLTDGWKLEEKEAEEENQAESVKKAVSYISDEISQKLIGVNPADQTAVDDIIYDFIEGIRQEREDELAKEAAGADAATVASPQPSSAKKAKSPKGKKSGPPLVITPDPPAEVDVPGSELVSNLSVSVCRAAAHVTDTPLYHHIATLCGRDLSEGLCLPLPVVTILQAGKSSPGKLNCVKEFMVTPCPGLPLTEAIQKIQAIQKTVFKNLFPKAGASLRTVSELGAPVVTLDRPEQGLDIIQDAANQLELIAGTDYNIILNISAKDTFDYDKGRYEVITGQFKSPDELVDFLADIVLRYPSVIGLIDPLRSPEKEQWYKLGEKISEQCFLLDESGHERPGKLRNSLKFTEHFSTSGLAFQVNHTTTVSHLIDCCATLRELGHGIMLSTGVGETTDTFLTDLAVGLGAGFLRVGGLSRGERMSKINRLLDIEAELSSHNLLLPGAPHQFPKVAPLEVPPTEEDLSQGENQSISQK